MPQFNESKLVIGNLSDLIALIKQEQATTDKNVIFVDCSEVVFKEITSALSANSIDALLAGAYVNKEHDPIMVHMGAIAVCGEMGDRVDSILIGTGHSAEAKAMQQKQYGHCFIPADDNAFFNELTQWKISHVLN